MVRKFYISLFFSVFFMALGTSSNANCLSGDPIVKTSKLSLDIFPNPASSVTNLNIKGSKDTQILILNSLGKVIKEVQMKSELTSLPVDDLNAGLYIIKVKDLHSDAVVSKRLLVRK